MWEVMKQRSKEARAEARRPADHGVSKSLVPEWEDLGYTRLFSERVRILLIAERLSNTLCAKSEKREERAGDTRQFS